MRIGDAVSALTGGFWSGFQTTTTGLSRIPRTATLTLSSLTETSGVDGGRVSVWTDIQSLVGSLQPTTAKEQQEWSKQTMTADYKFFFASSEFTSDANAAELKESAKLTQSSPARTFNIIGVMDRSVDGDHYKVILERKM